MFVLRGFSSSKTDFKAEVLKVLMSVNLAGQHMTEKKDREAHHFFLSPIRSDRLTHKELVTFFPETSFSPHPYRIFFHGGQGWSSVVGGEHPNPPPSAAKPV